jgi:hypothetical protein
VKLRAEWNEAASTLALSVANRSWYVSSAMVWDHIDPLLRTVQGTGNSMKKEAV